MKLEKRSSGAAEPETETTPAGKKPVVIYIMILFIAAFLLMALSFVMHQRSNSEVLGELQSSVSAMQEIQNTQEQLAALQTQLNKQDEEQETLKTQLSDAQAAADAAQQESDALLALYTLQQQYAAGNLDACRETLQSMADSGLVQALPTESTAGVTAPAQRYEELKDAILNH